MIDMHVKACKKSREKSKNHENEHVPVGETFFYVQLHLITRFIKEEKKIGRKMNAFL